MLKSSERTILQFDVRIEGSAAGGRTGAISGLTPLTMAKSMEYVKRLYDESELLNRQNRAETVTWYLADISVTAGYAALLINRSDKTSADFVLSEPAKARRRLIKKNYGEGADYSAHVVLNLTPFAPNMYRVVIEQSPGLSSTKIGHFINLLLRQCGFKYREEMMRPHPNGAMEKDGTPKQVVLRTRFLFDGHPAEAVLNELESGVVESLELIDRKQKTQPWDSNGYIVEDKRVVKLKVNSTKFVGKFSDTIGSVCREARRNRLDVLRIRFKTLAGIPRSLDFDTGKAALLDADQYIKKEVIGNFSAPLDSSVAKIHPEIIHKMKVLARK